MSWMEAAEAGRSLANLIRHLGEFIRCALHRNGSPRPHPQPLPRAVYIRERREEAVSAAARLRPTAEKKIKLFAHEREKKNYLRRLFYETCGLWRAK